MPVTQPFQPVRGTHDLFGDAMRRFRQVTEAARRVAALYGYADFAPPVFEHSEVFHRTLGETSDVVSKETYSFVDRGGESLTLRPEFTAGIVRAFISNGLTQQLPFKAFYAGPAFRYERPQKGRLRQFHQVGVECLGADAPWHDVEAIACAMRFLEALGVADQAALEINSLGDAESRASYRAALVDYLAARRERLSPESIARLEKNPLRVLDSKQEQDRVIVREAPVLETYFTENAKAWWAEAQEGLAKAGISYRINPRLVRGLDYYTHTVFEVTTEALGAQNTVLAGGRYDGLAARMGGPEIPGFGWAAGVERLMLLMERAGVALPEPPRRVAVIPLERAQLADALEVAEMLRGAGVAAELIARNQLGKSLKKADAMGAAYAVIIGEEEAAQGTVTLKDLRTGMQETVARGELVEKIRITLSK